MLDAISSTPILDLLDSTDLFPPVILRTRPFSTCAEIKLAIAKRYRITIADLVGPCRKRRFALPRQIAMALSHRRLTRQGYSLTMIARAFGNRHHATILFAAKKFGYRTAPTRRGASSGWSNRPPMHAVSSRQIADMGDWLSLGGERAA